MALIDSDERDHEACLSVLAAAEGPLLVTWPVVTEAMHLVGDLGGWPAQRMIWEMIVRGAVEIPALGPSETARVHRLMEKYRDLPIDLADATIVAIAEARGLKRVFTLDSDFAVYRYRGREPFEIVPGGP